MNKELSNEELQKKRIVDHDEQMRGYLVYGAKAGALAGVAATTALFALQSRSSIINNLSPSAKLATIISMALGTTVIASENAVYQVRRQATDGTTTNQTPASSHKPTSWAQTAFHYRHPIVGGTFAAAVAAGAMLYSRDPYRSGTQKFLNIRLYGQGLALMALFGTIGLGSIVAQHNREEEMRIEHEAAERLYGSDSINAATLEASK